MASTQQLRIDAAVRLLELIDQVVGNSDKDKEHRHAQYAVDGIAAFVEARLKNQLHLLVPPPGA